MNYTKGLEKLYKNLNKIRCFILSRNKQFTLTALIHLIKINVTYVVSHKSDFKARWITVISTIVSCNLELEYFTFTPVHTKNNIVTTVTS